MAITPQKSNIAFRKGAFWNTDVAELLSGKRKKLPLRDLAVFCRETAFLLGAGLTLKDALPILAKKTDAKKFGAIVAQLHSLILQGESFSHAMRETGVFPAFVHGYISIGERTAGLPKVCAHLADYFESRATTREETTAALIYPCLVATMMVGVIAMAVTFVLPGYSQIFAASGVSLPSATAFLLAASNFVYANAVAIFVGICIILSVAAMFFQSATGRRLLAIFQLRFRATRTNINCNLAQGMSILLASGINISDAVPLCGEISGNMIVKGDFEQLSTQLHRGEAFSDALAKISYIDPLFVSLARVGDSAGILPSSIEKCSAYLTEASRREISRINKLLTPTITLIIGIVMAVVMLAVILPTFELAMTI